MAPSAASPSPLPLPAPLPPGRRLAVLDVLRGLAILGIFVVNSQFMMMPFDEALDPHRPPASDAWAWGLVKVLFEGKFVALFSMLFGMGFVLQHGRATDEGEFAALYRRRLAMLALFGLLHGTLLFNGDILLTYAGVGFLLLLARGRSTTDWLWIAALTLLVAVAGTSLLELLWGELTDAETVPAEIARHREGPLGDLIAQRAMDYGLWMLATMFGFNWRVVAAFFLGAALMRAGFFEPRHRAWQRRACLVGLGVGLPYQVLLAGLEWSEGASVAAALLSGLNEVFGLLLALGYLGAIALWVRSDRTTRLQGALAAVGRMALTNYLLQSLLANVYFTWMGLDLYAALTRWQLLALVLGTFAFQVLASVLWSRFFRRGPLEWLWRAATYRR